MTGDDKEEWYLGIVDSSTSIKGAFHLDYEWVGSLPVAMESRTILCVSRSKFGGKNAEEAFES